MGTAILAQYGAFDDKYSQMTEYLSSEGRYWIDNDQWYLEADSFRQAGINTEKRKTGKLADFSGYQSGQLKNEMKYFLLYSMKNGLMSVSNLYGHYREPIRQMGDSAGRQTSVRQLCGPQYGRGKSGACWQGIGKGKALSGPEAGRDKIHQGLL